ncbi:Calcium-binding protein 39-like (MO25beta) (Mo25-like protein), partial [Durusdinium trenchii]
EAARRREKPRTMAFIFKKKKTPKQLTEGLIEAMRSVSVILTKPLEPGTLPPLSATTTQATFTADDNAGLEVMQKRLEEVRTMMCGDTDNQPKKEDSVALAQNLREQGVPLTLIQNLGVLPFDTRNDAVHVLSYMIQGDLGSFASKYLRQRSRQVVRLLVDLFADPGIALHCGSLLRDCLMYEYMAAEFLEESCWVYDKFFSQYLCCESFDISSDAFATFRASLTNAKAKPLVLPFLMANYDHFFDEYNKLLVSDQYVTQRQSLKLLGELLLDRQNYNVMIRYIGDKGNLKVIMNLMRVKSPAIQMDAFHVFKVFVVNPRKTEPVAQILSKNREKIIPYLHTLHADTSDQQFIEERNLLIGTLSKMKVASPAATQAPAAASTPSAAPVDQPPAPADGAESDAQAPPQPVPDSGEATEKAPSEQLEPDSAEGAHRLSSQPELDLQLSSFMPGVAFFLMSTNKRASRCFRLFFSARLSEIVPTAGHARRSATKD